MGTAENKKTTSGRALWFAATLLGGALVSSAASASPVFTFDGIGFGTNSNLISNTIWENTVLAPGATLTGIGRVDTIDSVSCGGLCWTTGTNGHELTFEFSYTVEKIGFLSGSSGPAQALFSGGIINFYSDGSPDLTDTPGGLTHANAVDGNLWLSLVGGPTGDPCDATCFNGAGAVVTLNSLFLTTGGLGAVSSGTGHGFLNVSGGPVGSFFDTNTFPLGNDIDLSSSFHNNLTTPNNFPLAGTAALQTDVRPVPEPDSLLLFGTGLASLAAAGFGRKRRRSRA